MLLILAILVIVGFGFHVMTPAERARLLRSVLALGRQVRPLVAKRRSGPDVFDQALRARTPWVIVTPVLAALNVAVFLGMLFGEGSITDPATLTGWGGSVAPRTTNGEWWRLMTSLFVHAGVLHLIVNMIGLVHIGLLLERVVGHLTFGAVYVTTGVLASLVALAADPIAVSAGASGAILGTFGLLLASSAWGWLPRSPLTVPLATLGRIGPTVVVVLLYNMANDNLASVAELTALAAGFGCGLVLSWDVSVCKPPARRVSAAVASTCVIAVTCAVPLRGVTDVRPEIARVIGVEGRTTRAYDAALRQFRLGAATAETLARVIEDGMLPELRAARARLRTFDRVPHQHLPLLAAAEAYLRLREEGWSLRAEALKSHDMLKLQQADGIERTSLQAFEQIRGAESP